MFARFRNPDLRMITMTNSMVTTQNPGVAPPMERILQMFEKLKGLFEATATQQNVIDLAEKVDDLAEQAKRARVLWKAN
ncbi:hypothetical protein ACLB2K_065421 [Fragaria x ananassa]